MMMVRRRGELSPAAVDRGWPHQVALRIPPAIGLGPEPDAFCEAQGLSLCERGHTVRHEDADWRVFCFAEREHADTFRERFSGEPFNPKDRGKGASWARWRKPVVAVVKAR